MPPPRPDSDQGRLHQILGGVRMPVSRQAARNNASRHNATKSAKPVCSLLFSTLTEPPDASPVPDNDQ
jgi:hypothetical protein